jgi:hypothetical protein
MNNTHKKFWHIGWVNAILLALCLLFSILTRSHAAGIGHDIIDPGALSGNSSKASVLNEQGVCQGYLMLPTNQRH